jgi:hypothetical protein
MFSTKKNRPSGNRSPHLEQWRSRTRHRSHWRLLRRTRPPLRPRTTMAEAPRTPCLRRSGLHRSAMVRCRASHMERIIPPVGLYDGRRLGRRRSWDTVHSEDQSPGIRLPLPIVQRIEHHRPIVPEHDQLCVAAAQYSGLPCSGTSYLNPVSTR